MSIFYDGNGYKIEVGDWIQPDYCEEIFKVTELYFGDKSLGETNIVHCVDKNNQPINFRARYVNLL